VIRPWRLCPTIQRFHQSEIIIFHQELCVLEPLIKKMPKHHGKALDLNLHSGGRSYTLGETISKSALVIPANTSYFAFSATLLIRSININLQNSWIWGTLEMFLGF